MSKSFDLVTAEWKTSELGRPAKFYSLTRIGRRHGERGRQLGTALHVAIPQVVRLKEA